MAESRGPSPMPGRFLSGGPFDAAPPLNYSGHQQRRQRPPDLGAITVDHRVPLREEKVQKKESRMGLRSIFTRSTRNLRDAKDSDKEKEKERMRNIQEHHHHHHHHHHDEHHHHQPLQQPQPQPQPQPPCPLHPQPQHSATDGPGPSSLHPTHSRHLRNTPSKSGLRASILDFGHNHWSSSASVESRLEAPLPDLPPAPDEPAPPMPAQRAATDSQPAIRRQKSGTLPSRPQRAATDVPWQPPPLFQAYPQAIKYIHLRASAISGDALLRLYEKNEKKGASSLRDDLYQHSPGMPPQDEQAAATTTEKGGDKEKRKLRHHRRHQSGSLAKFEWTTKIYVLVTSGYLLQYAGAGPFDRPPEKILSLTKDSAAFASDMIPGKHWVLHVASQMDAESSAADPTAAAPSRSLLSRLPFRVADRRHASNFFMVFEDGEDMEAWILVLRKEIEALGGKKNLAETDTGQPEAEHGHHGHSMSVDHGVRSKTSQRTLVVRDPNRFSRIMPSDVTWAPSSLSDSGHNSDDGHIKRSYERSDKGLDPERPSHETTTDAMSTTNSFISHDGRQLDNLRESNHRLSLISSGQRTVITSPGSSPACSPLREAFSSHVKDEPRTPGRDVHSAMAHSHQPLFIHDEIRARPNAAEILDRRQSLRTGNPFLGDMAIFANSMAPIALSQYAEPAAPLHQPIHAMPNFSVPHTISRRCSFVRAAPTMDHEIVASPETDFTRNYGRRPPPPPLPLNPRSSSIAADRAHTKPIPIAVSRRSSMRPDDGVLAASHVQGHLRRRSSVESTHLLARQASPVFLPSPSNRPAGAYSADARASSPRKYASMHALRSQSVSSAPLLPAFDMSRTKLKRDSLPPIPRIPGSPSTSPMQTPTQFLTVPLAPPQRMCPSSPPTAPLEMGRCASSLGIRSETRPRSPTFSSPGRSPSSVARRRKRASLQVLPSAGSAVPRSMSASTDALGIMMPSNHVASLMASSARAASVSMHAGLDLSHHQGPGNRRSLPQLVEGPPPAPPPTRALPPIPQKSAFKS